MDTGTKTNPVLFSQYKYKRDNQLLPWIALDQFNSTYRITWLSLDLAESVQLIQKEVKVSTTLTLHI